MSFRRKNMDPLFLNNNRLQSLRILDIDGLNVAVKFLLGTIQAKD
jgi:hypothetical protein